jgi:hypothetical protein
MNIGKWALSAFLIAALTIAAPAFWWHVAAERAMRLSELPGTYTSDGVWGNSTLVMRSDHTFTQLAHFKNEISGKAEGDRSIEGTWMCTHHTNTENQLEFRPFIRLAPWDAQKIDRQFDTTYSMMITAAALNVSPGAGIYYFRR